MSMLTQNQFDQYAAAWLRFINEAGPDEVPALFRHVDKEKGINQAQLHVDFDLPGTVLPLLSTVGIARVMLGFVLVDEGTDAPRFGLAAYALDALGGRISAYYLGTSAWEDLDGQLDSCKGTIGDPDASNLAGMVPFNLIKGWLCNWAWAMRAEKLSADVFGTSSYGPLQGYAFELSDFLDPLFQTKKPDATAVRANFGLKLYYPAYPEKWEQPTSTFGLVLRLYSPGDKLNDAPGGPSYDMAKPSPPY